MKHIKLLSLLAIFAFGIFSKANAQCGAAYQWSCIGGAFNSVQFYDSSMAFNSGSYTCFWNFGDGTSDTSHNPLHAFNTVGPHHVCLIINNNGCQATYCDTTIACGSGGGVCQAYFYSQNNGTLQEWFQDASSGTTATTVYYYDFGDGTNSTQQNPSHTYANAGTYNVCLSILDTANGGCTDTFCNSITVPNGGNGCVANFTWTSAGNTAAFTNLSSNSGFATYAWTFGDGGTSNSRNPAHTYASAGTYNVCVTMTDTMFGGGSCTSTYCDSITVGGAMGGPCSISGMIGNNGAVQDYATVWLIQHDSAMGTLYAIDSVHITPVNQGTYIFNNVAAGSYLVKVAADTQSANYTTLVPTYYGNVLFWNNAVTVLVCPSQSNVNISLTIGVNPGGPGFVGGLVSQGANRMMNFGDPMNHIEILVLNMNNTPVQYQYSASNGLYGFNNLGYGTYKI
ncbi:MAG: PKD domain-containing protein [Sphingobacteriales bacterium]|nr:MAG: PKD domain-containing protein [Sphingobacteriales bacterium]